MPDVFFFIFETKRNAFLFWVWVLCLARPVYKYVFRTYLPDDLNELQMNRYMYVQQFCKSTLSETQITSYTDYYTLISYVIGKQSKLSPIGSGEALGNCIALDNKSRYNI